MKAEVVSAESPPAEVSFTQVTFSNPVLQKIVKIMSGDEEEG